MFISGIIARTESHLENPAFDKPLSIINQSPPGSKPLLQPYFAPVQASVALVAATTTTLVTSVRSLQ